MPHLLSLRLACRWLARRVRILILRCYLDYLHIFWHETINVNSGRNKEVSVSNTWVLLSFTKQGWRPWDPLGGIGCFNIGNCGLIKNCVWPLHPRRLTAGRLILLHFLLSLPTLSNAGTYLNYAYCNNN